jgi:hypothetical protein
MGNEIMDIKGIHTLNPGPAKIPLGLGVDALTLETVTVRGLHQITVDIVDGVNVKLHAAVRLGLRVRVGRYVDIVVWHVGGSAMEE